MMYLQRPSAEQPSNDIVAFIQKWWSGGSSAAQGEGGRRPLRLRGAI